MPAVRPVGAIVILVELAAERVVVPVVGVAPNQLPPAEVVAVAVHERARVHAPAAAMVTACPTGAG